MKECNNRKQHSNNIANVDGGQFLNDQIQSGDDGVCVHKSRSLLSRFKLADRNF